MITVSCSAADVAPSLSVNVTVHTLLPELPAAGVKVSSPAGLSCGCTLNSALLVHATVNAIVWLASPGPAEMLLAQALLKAPELSGTVTLAAPLAKEGASLTTTNGLSTMQSVCC